jgi:hypothetical protein
MSTVGAPQSTVMRSRVMRSNTSLGSIFGAHTCTPPAAVTVQVNVQPFA